MALSPLFPPKSDFRKVNIFNLETFMLPAFFLSAKRARDRKKCCQQILILIVGRQPFSSKDGGLPIGVETSLRSLLSALCAFASSCLIAAAERNEKLRNLCS